MSEPKFTKGPWHIEGDTGFYDGNYYYRIVDEIGYTIADIENLNNETKRANAQLISCSPDLYASEAKNLELLKIPYHAFQYMLALCKADVKIQTFVVDQLKVKFEDIEKFAKEYEERIAETEQLLKKARGEE